MRTLRHQIIEFFMRMQFKWIIHKTKQQQKPNSNDWILYLRQEFDKRAPKASGAEVKAIEGESFTGLIVKSKEINSKKVILFFHGGAYAIGSPKLYTMFATYLSRASHATVYLIDYRMVPNYYYEDAILDALNAYQYLLRNGHQPNDICVGGDSAGGGLACALLFTLREKKLPMPERVFLLSPWVDLEMSSASLTANYHKDYMVSFIVEWFEEFVRLYSRGGDLKNPLLSPVYGQFHDFPPVFLISGGDECLLDENKLLAEKMRDAGVALNFEIWPDMPHDFLLLIPYLPEAGAALQKLGRFVQGTV